MGAPCLVVFCALLFGHSYGSPVSPTYDTIVIGLGASGTAAATTLAKAGKKVLALEAQNRIGGRVYTAPFGNGIAELGAEWIHGIESSSTYELAIKNNITILDDVSSNKIVFSDGVSDREDIISDLVGFSLDVVDERPKEPEPMGQYITRRVREYIKTKYPSIQNDTDFIDSFLEWMDIILVSYESANSWNDVTTHTTSVNLKGSQTMSWHKYGYKTLFDILLNTYNNGPGYPSLDIKLNTEVTQIRWPLSAQDNVVVTVKDGTTYTGRTAIVTASVGVLKERYKTLFSPPLPEDKANAIEAIQIGVCGKIIFRFAEVWWTPNSFTGFLWRRADREKVSEEDKWMLKIEAAATPRASNETLMLWVCGDAAKQIEILPEEELKNKSMSLVRRFMGVNTTVPDPVEMIRTSWYSNPFTRGSYSYDDVSLPSHPHGRAALARPLTDEDDAPRLLFAGEATDTLHFATVHGALDTGFREAARLLPAASTTTTTTGATKI